MITYKETGRTPIKNGIDVTVQFLNGKDVVQTTTFRFVNEKEIEHDFTNRCERKATGIQYEIDHPPKPELSRDAVEEKLREWKYLNAGESFEDLKVTEVRAL